MTRGRFTGVVYGEFETSGGFPVTLLAAGLGIAALLSWLATVLVELAAVAGVVLAALTGVVLLLRRTSDRDMQLLEERTKAMHAEIDASTQKTAVPQQVTVFHGGTHYHLMPGSPVPAGIREDGQVIQASPLRGAITEIKED